MKRIGIIMFVSVLLLFCCIPFVNASSKEGGKTLIENGETCCTPSEEPFCNTIRKIARELGIPDSVMTSKKVHAILEKYNNDLDDYLFYRDDREPRYPHFLLSQKIKTDIECQLYLSLKNGIILNPKTNREINENARISSIIDMLSKEKIFETRLYGSYGKTLVNIMQEILTEPQQIRLKECILTLKDCCDAKGIKSILQSASKNNAFLLICPYEKNVKSKERLLEYFVKRLELMAKYIKDVYYKFDRQYWIYSTGSDPHHECQHALFLANKETNKISWVYKPHDMSADAAVIGKTGY